jgi:hypothetical protein
MEKVLLQIQKGANGKAVSSMDKGLDYTHWRQSDFLRDPFSFPRACWHGFSAMSGRGTSRTLSTYFEAELQIIAMQLFEKNRRDFVCKSHLKCVFEIFLCVVQDFLPPRIQRRTYASSTVGRDRLEGWLLKTALYSSF